MKITTGILQERDDFGEGLVHRLEALLEAAGPAADSLAAALRADPDQLGREGLVRERVDDGEIDVRRRRRCPDAVHVMHGRLAVGQAQDAEEVDRLGTVDARHDVVARVACLRVRTYTTQPHDSSVQQCQCQCQCGA